MLQDFTPSDFVDLWFDAGDLIEFRPTELRSDRKVGRIEYDLREWRKIGGIRDNAPFFVPGSLKTWLEDWGRKLETYKLNAFYGVFPREGAKGFTQAEQIRKANGFCTDIDGVASPEEALEKIRAAGLPNPTVGNWTGNGAHFYWRLKQAARFDAPPPVKYFNRKDEKGFTVYFKKVTREDGVEIEVVRDSAMKALCPMAQRIHNIQRGIYKSVSNADHTHDLARIMRLVGPGWENRKDAALGKEPRATYCFHVDPDALYSLEQFDVYATAGAIDQRYKNVPLPSTRKLSPKGKDWIALKLFQAEASGDRSSADFEICAEAVAKGWEPEAVWELVKDASKFAERTYDNYFLPTWESAANKFREERGRKAVLEKVVSGQATSTAEVEEAAALAEDMMKRIQLDVLGEDDMGNVHVFSIYYRKTDKIRDVSRLQRSRLLQLCGVPGLCIQDMGEERIAGTLRLKDVRDAIGLLAGRRRVTGGDLAGQGVWQGLTAEHEESETIVLVGANEAARLNGTFERVLSPRVDGLLLDLSDPDPWYDLPKLQEYVAACRGSREWAEGVLDQASDLFGQWCWKNDRPNEQPDTLLVTLLACATWAQTLWGFRPLVAITGPSNSGKTSFFLLLEALFGKLALRSSSSSAAGILQHVRRSAKIILLDEFEDSIHRKKVLELFRLSSRGDKRLMGTTTHSGQDFNLQHIPWVAAIEVNLKREPDRNRFITLELLKPPADRFTKGLTMPSPEKLADLGQKMLAVALCHAPAARRLAAKLKSCRPTDAFGETMADDRVIEAYAVPAALLACIRGEGEKEGLLALRTLLGGVEKAEQGRTDELALLEVILEAHVDCGHGRRLAVSQIVFGDIETFDANKVALERSGIRLGADRTGPLTNPQAARWLFIAPGPVSANLLRSTDWAYQKIETILKRLPGAKPDRKEIADKKATGVSIPMEFLVKTFGTEAQQSEHA